MPRTSSTAKKQRKPTRRTAARRRPAKRAVKAGGGRRPISRVDPLFGEVQGATRLTVAGVLIEAGPAGAARVRRVVYPAGFHWAADMKPTVETELCMHAHVGLLARGQIHIEYADGCTAQFRAPQIVAIEPGHDGWVVGDEPAVLIEFDFERETLARLGMPAAHRHA